MYFCSELLSVILSTILYFFLCFFVLDGIFRCRKIQVQREFYVGTLTSDDVYYLICVYCDRANYLILRSQDNTFWLTVSALSSIFIFLIRYQCVSYKKQKGEAV